MKQFQDFGKRFEDKSVTRERKVIGMDAGGDLKIMSSNEKQKSKQNWNKNQAETDISELSQKSWEVKGL